MAQKSKSQRRVDTAVNSLSEISKKISGSIKKDASIPDIITFCESKEYLGCSLYPMQKLILKVFYRGTRGNENLKLTEQELFLCEKYELNNSKDRGDVLGKYNSNVIFSELALICGRRSGKDFMASIIACYDVMRLLEIPGGDPHAHYQLGDAIPFSVLTVANSQDQAGIAFSEIKTKILKSPYFQGKFLQEGITSLSISLLTPKDRRENEIAKSKNMPITRGSVIIETGHSNSDSLLGTNIYTLILDEVASYKQTAGSSSGQRILEALRPNTKTCKRKIYDLDKNGNRIPLYENDKPMLEDDGSQMYKSKTIFDGKIIFISSPRGKEGVLWKVYSENKDSRLICRLPTWVMNNSFNEDSLREEVGGNQESFYMEYGAEFSGTSGSNFFDIDKVEHCFREKIEMVDMGRPGALYFLHLDPARTSHNYAIAIVHKEIYLREAGKYDFKIYVDHVKSWKPTPDNPINIDSVDEYILALKLKFKIGLVTHDHCPIDSTVQKMKKIGMMSRMTRYSFKYKMIIYDNLLNIVNAGRLIIPPSGKESSILRGEMLNLQRKFTNQGYRIFPNIKAEHNTDDSVDCIAGATYSCIMSDSEGTLLPKSVINDSGVFGGGEQRQWNSMQGPIGFGTGANITRQLERINSYPKSQR